MTTATTEIRHAWSANPSGVRRRAIERCLLMELDRPRQCLEKWKRNCCVRCGRKFPLCNSFGKHCPAWLDKAHMSALSVLGLARQAGVEVQLDGDDLELAATSEPPAVVLHLLTRHKAEVVTLLRLCSHGWSAEDWHAYFDERAGIAEYDGKLSRQLAEAQAFACCVLKWRELTLQPSPPGRCVSCGEGEQPGNPLLPYGIGTFSPACLHDHCWPAWHCARRSEAVEAIKQMGIQPIADRELQEDTLLSVEISFLPWIEASDCGPMDRPTQRPATNEQPRKRQQ